jgi:hypothetical protein
VILHAFARQSYERTLQLSDKAGRQKAKYCHISNIRAVNDKAGRVYYGEGYHGHAMKIYENKPG